MNHESRCSTCPVLLQHPMDAAPSSGRCAAYQNLGGVGAVDGDGVDQQLHGLGVDGAGVGDLLVVDITDVHLHHRHAIGGQCACLVRTDGRGVAHGLTGVQVAYQVVILHHFLAEGAGDRAAVRKGSWGPWYPWHWVNTVSEAELPCLPLCFLHM